MSDDGGSGANRWHLPSGELRQRAATTDAATTTGATSTATDNPTTSASATWGGDVPQLATTGVISAPVENPTSSSSAPTDNPTSSSSATWGGDNTQNDNSAPSSSTTRENQARKGFYRHGEWVDRERTQEKLRRHAGGQGTTRRARRLARVQEYARGEWVQAWLRDYRRGKEERDRERHRYDTREGGGGQGEPWKQWGDWRNEPDHAELWQQGRGRLHARGDVYITEESDEVGFMYTTEETDEVGFMDKPGLKGEEKELLRRGGVAQEHVDGLDDILRQYERYCSNDLGSEARWALGMWLAQSQIGADVQDLAETFIADRAQSPVCFPNRREPSDPHLRLALVRWANTLSPIMTSIYGGSHSASFAGATCGYDGVVVFVLPTSTKTFYTSFEIAPTKTNYRYGGQQPAGGVE